MADNFLSQEEVDALLKGVNGDQDDAQQQEDVAGVRTYNLATQERIVRGRMPTLEIINERFARLLRVGLFNFLRRSAEVSVGSVRVSKYSEFIRNLVVPTNLNLVHMKPLRGTALMVFDPGLVFLLVDNLFGGDGRFHTRVEGRDFTQTEQRIILRILDIVFEAYTKPWEPVFPVEPFTVNLQPGEAGGDQYLQLAFTLEVGGLEEADNIKKNMAKVRNRVLLLLSSKKAADINTPDGKVQLSKEITEQLSEPFEHRGDKQDIIDVLFTSFIIQ